MKGKNIIAMIISEEGWNKDYPFPADIKAEIKREEPDSLGEISDVTYAYNRLILTVHDPIAARKFNLLDNYEKYEIDEDTIYLFADKDKASSESYSIGSNGKTLVTAGTERCIAAVREEMFAQVVKKKLDVPRKLLGNVATPTEVAGYLGNR